MKKIIIPVMLILCLFAPHQLLWANDELRINDSETLIYEITDENNNMSMAVCKYKVQMEYGKKLFSYTHTHNNEIWKVLTDTRANPLHIVYINGNNRMTLLFDKPGRVVLQGYWEDKQMNKTRLFSTPVTLENALKARTLDLSTDQKQKINLLQTDKFPDLEPYEMYFKVIGEENLTVKAGIFTCKKVLFTLKGWRGMFFKAYYYISDDAHRYLVKMENIPRNGCSELVKIE